VIVGRQPGEEIYSGGVDESGLREEFVEFYRREYASVVRLAFVLTGRHELAEEFTQDAFLAAERRWGRIRDYDRPEAWVRRVATNRCVSGFRKASGEVRALARLGRRRSEPVELPEADSELWAALRRLPKRQAQTLALMYIEDRSPTQVALLLGCSEETVRTHVRRGRPALAHLLGLTVEEEE
jgi:RNA polymerase sigma-70 factor (ECF subfamily)